MKKQRDKNKNTVKKHIANKPNTEGKPHVGHLDDALTQITTTTAERLKKWRKPLIAAILAVVLVVIVSSALSGWRETKEEDLNQRLYQLVGSSAAQKDGYQVDKQAIEALLADVRGTKTEMYVVREIVDFYLAQADKAAKKAEDDAAKAKADAAAASPGAEVPTPPATIPTPPAVGPSAPAVVNEGRDMALKIVADVANRFLADAEIQGWASKIKAKIEGERKQGWLPTGWKYTLPPAGSPPGTGSPQSTAPGSPQSTAPGPSSSAPPEAKQ